ncbi:MAG: hypothetical protein AMJ54_12915 [Deltaproteobacteria bacterium SG8_13]|nr:MAG: hypothetical protein AMJ54_12915 [Deltaproteobacteria bacterium SG8_13]
MHGSTKIVFLACCWLVLPVGCAYLPLPHMPAPHLPESWTATAADFDAIADRTDEARLQVIIAYGQLVDNHAALRLVSPGHPVLFWDPGGGYNKQSAPRTRWNDIIIEDPPDLKTYLAFRRTHFDTAVEIFEWRITPGQANRLADVLRYGTDGSHPAGPFRSETVGLFCSEAISDFLGRFAGDIMTISETYFWPNELAKALYTQAPYRVIVFRSTDTPVIYQPPSTAQPVLSPPPASAPSHSTRR